MRIETIFVDGFGIWHESRLEPDPGLTIVCGDNEAGKTTLLAFVRAILFGFETNQYPAVAGGRRGGWLEVLTADDRRFRIERYGERGGQGTLRVTGADGAERGPDFLSRLLHGVEASVYRNVFAFRLEELTELKGLTEGGVAARIYGAGLGTGAASALTVESELAAEVASLFKPGGSNPRINQLLRQIEESERRLAAVDLPAEYAALRRRLAEAESERRRLAEAIESREAERRRLERVDAAWQPTQALLAAQEALGDEQEPRPLPDGALERFTRLEAAARASSERLDEAAARRCRAEQRLAQVQPDAELLSRRPGIEAVLEAYAVVRAESRSLADAEQQLAAAQREAADALAQLGEGWTAERVSALDLSVGTRAVVAGRFRDLLDRAARDVERHQIELTAAEAEAAHAGTELASLDRRLAHVGEQRDARPPSRWRGRRAAAVLPVVGALAALALFASGLAVAGAGVALAGVVAGVAWWLARGSGGDMAGARRAAVDERRAMAEERAAQARSAVDTARSALDAAAGRAEQARDEWGRWLNDHGYATDLDRETALTLFDAASAARALLRRRDEAAETVGRLVADRDAMIAGARALLDELGRAAAADAVPGALDALARDLRGAAEAEQAAARLEQEVSELVDDERLAAERRDGDATALTALFEECGVADEAELRTRAANLERRRAQREAAAAARQSLATLAGHGEAVDRLVAEVLAVADIAEVRDRLGATRSELADMAAERDAVLQEIGALQRHVETLEASADASEARQHHADLVSLLEAEAETWSVRRLAVALMQRTRQRYEREHRPGVIRTAERFLAEWTDGRWVRIVAPLGAAIDGLERADGRQVSIAALSRGTQEQLYLALRFGLIEHFADEAEPLPIVMDETLVNFDEGRAERTARTIEQMSARHQILYFTCRRTTPFSAARTLRLHPPTLAGAVGADRPPTLEPAAG